MRVEYQSGHAVLDGAALSVEPGEVVALVGANGAGKSTMLRSLIGLVPAVGRIDIDGLDVTRANRRELRELRRRTGFVAQRFGLATNLSAFSNVMHGALGRGGMRRWWACTAPAGERDEALRCLERVGLADRARDRVEQLSGGQRQRVAVARMLLQSPTLVLADEPVASLDPIAGESVMALIRDIARERGITAVLALHQLDFARRYTDRVVALRDGRVVLDCAAAEFEQQSVEGLYAAVTM
jgi:phosphonate transport system ATP-binding protein